MREMTLRWIQRSALDLEIQSRAAAGFDRFAIL